MRIRLALVGAVILGGTAVLAGCVAQAPAPAASSAPAADDTPAPTPEQDPVAACLVGTWQLDTEDFVAQSQAYMTGLGIPVDTVTVEGGQQLVFAADGFTSQSTDLTWTATLMGQTITVPSEAAGEGAWTVTDGALAVTDWVWQVDPADSPPPTGLPAGAAVPDLGGFLMSGLTVPDVQCDDEILVLQGTGAPLRGVFVRFG